MIRWKIIKFSQKRLHHHSLRQQQHQNQSCEDEVRQGIGGSGRKELGRDEGGGGLCLLLIRRWSSSFHFPFLLGCHWITLWLQIENANGVHCIFLLDLNPFPLHPKNGPHGSSQQLNAAQEKNEVLLHIGLCRGDVDCPSQSHQEIQNNCLGEGVREEEPWRTDGVVSSWFEVKLLTKKNKRTIGVPQAPGGVKEISQ
jgi:hypothetical protein